MFQSAGIPLNGIPMSTHFNLSLIRSPELLLASIAETTDLVVAVFSWRDLE